MKRQSGFSFSITVMGSCLLPQDPFFLLLRLFFSVGWENENTGLPLQHL